MKKSFSLFTLISSLLILSSSLYATPSWYYNISHTKPNFYIGYGSGESESEAKQNALIDISSQISTKIDSNLETSKRKVGNSYDKDIIVKSSQKTNSNISDFEVVKLELEDGKYYIALEYENIPNLDKFANKLKRYKLSNETQNNYIKNTLIAKELKRLINFDIDFKLTRVDKKWYLKYKDVMQIIYQKDLEKFFASNINNIEIRTNKKTIYDGDEFYFKIKSKQDGYISILTVYEDATVTTLFKNIPIKKDIQINVPDKEFEEILEAGILKQGEDTFDMYVVILSNKKLYLDNFVKADEELMNQERYKNFHTLIDSLNDKEFSTLKVITKAR